MCQENSPQLVVVGFPAVRARGKTGHCVSSGSGCRVAHTRRELALCLARLILRLRSGQETGPYGSRTLVRASR